MTQDAQFTADVATTDNAQKPEFSIQRIYIKDLSYEVPNSPEIFKTEWSPKVELNLEITHKKITDDIYEVVLKLTVTTKLQDKAAFLAEIQQAGIFTLKNFSEKHLDAMLGSFCPNILFPYAREVVSDTVSRGGFPPLYLAPVNFDALYEQKLAKIQTASEEK
jgi:preprotein translocase subunit SecB